MAKVVKVEMDRNIVFENQKIRDTPITLNGMAFRSIPPQQVANKDFEILVNYHIKLGNKIYLRTEVITLPGRKREIVKHEKINTYFLMEKEEFEIPLLKGIQKQEEKFYLSEKELISNVKNLLENNYEVYNFRTQVEIDGCISDGLAFINDNKVAKIIGFEVKSNQDNYYRLYSQLNSYQTICDEVYLVIQDKTPPVDLPYFVGIIQVNEGGNKIIRYAQSLKHSIDVKECWSTLLKSFNKHVGIDKEDNIIKFFYAIENIKRKLIWNQFVIGFHKSYVKDYMKIETREKKIIKEYFKHDKNIQYELIKGW